MAASSATFTEIKGHDIFFLKKNKSVDMKVGRVVQCMGHDYIVSL